MMSKKFQTCLVHSAYLICEQCVQECIAALERDLATAQADVREHIALCLAANKLVDEARAEAAALREQYGRVRDAFHVNMLRAYPELSHADIDAAIDAARGGGNG